MAFDRRQNSLDYQTTIRIITGYIDCCSCTEAAISSIFLLKLCGINKTQTTRRRTSRTMKYCVYNDWIRGWRQREGTEYHNFLKFATNPYCVVQVKPLEQYVLLYMCFYFSYIYSFCRKKKVFLRGPVQ